MLIMMLVAVGVRALIFQVLLIILLGVPLFTLTKSITYLIII